MFLKVIGEVPGCVYPFKLATKEICTEWLQLDAFLLACLIRSASECDLSLMLALIDYLCTIMHCEAI